jgi:ATP-dependent RNA circularization protein (DNA/RNA ligase family)
LKQDEANSFWKVAISQDIEAKMRAEGKDNFAIQGEMIGNGVQGNIYKLGGLDFYVFDVYDIQGGEYMLPDLRRALVDRMGLKNVPVISSKTTLGTVEEILKQADGKSTLNPHQDREGIVFKQIDGGMTFKSVSNAWLLKNE